MTRVLDHQTVELALRRAAWKAAHGTREQQSGKYIPADPAGVKVGEGSDVPAPTPKRRIAR